MIARISPHRLAGWLLFVPALGGVAIWYVYLFSAPPLGLSAMEGAMLQLRYTFSEENSHAWWFAWLIAFPSACACLGLAYLLNVGRTRMGRIALFSMMVALAVAALLLKPLGLAALLAAPLFCGYRAIHAPS